MTDRIRLDEVLVADEWLAAVIGRPAWRLTSHAAGFGLLVDETGEPSAALTDALGEHAFVYAKVPVEGVSAAGGLCSAGFLLADVTLTFERPVQAGAAAGAESGSAGRVRFAVAEDEEAVAELARTSFTVSRFHMDKGFAPGVGDAVKACWARGFFRGIRGDAMVVATHEGRLAGFLQLLGPDDGGMLVIDLVAVAEDARGRGLAGEMISFAETWLMGVRTLRVGSQAANAVAVRFYEDAGFRFSYATGVYHWHGPRRTS